MKKLKKVYRQTVRRLSWFLYRKNRILNKKLSDSVYDGVKLHIGCGDKKRPGYLNIDIVPTEATDVVIDVAQGLSAIPDNIASEIRLESVFEHFYRYDQEQILREFRRILKKDGKLVILWLPDFDAIIQAYQQKQPGVVGEIFDLFNIYRYTHGDPVPRNSPQQLHKDIFTRETIKPLLENQGFYIETLENAAFPREQLAIGINITAVKS
ncbi:methyltransferase domain-containing protein [Candidatus Omnitrophota bacterium]